MSKEMDVGFVWKSIYKPSKVELLCCKAAGIYKDPFTNKDDYSTYELEPSDQTVNNLNSYRFIRILSLKQGIYHFIFRVYRTEDSECETCTSDFYEKTQLASGREVNYIEVSQTKPTPRSNYSNSLSRNDSSSYQTAREWDSYSDNAKDPLLDYYDKDEEESKCQCCTII